MAEPFIGQIALFGFNFAPRNWALCQGQIMSIQQNAALFSLLGTNFGGNGTTNFGLPNLQGTVPAGQGTGVTGTVYYMGEVGGAPQVSLTVSTIPPHTHAMTAYASAATTNTLAAGTWPAQGHTGSKGSSHAVNTFAPTSSATAPTALSPSSVSTVTGGGLPHNNMQPTLTANWCICLAGAFPARP